jgi:hypothetical protein
MDGWKLVPVEPTETALRAGWNSARQWENACINMANGIDIATHIPKPTESDLLILRDQYRAMLAAAPSPPEREGERKRIFEFGYEWAALRKGTPEQGLAALDKALRGDSHE